MNIVKKSDGTVLTLALEGRLDTASAPELEAELRSGLSGITELILDLERLQYLSSAGLRVLLLAQKMMGRQGATMRVQNVCETIMEVFQVTGFTEILTIQ